MTILEALADRDAWEEYLIARVESGHLNQRDAQQVRAYIDRKGFMNAVSSIENGVLFDPPRKSLISKSGTNRKRTVYTYADDDSLALKFITHRLLRSYDHLFSDRLYSFREKQGVGKALSSLFRTPGLSEMYIYKADIHDYFNSVDVDKLLPILKNALPEERCLCDFLCALLSDSRALEKGEIIHEKKGIMAGTPQAVFYANLYLSEMDAYFEKTGAVYCRYSDDILIAAPTQEALDEMRARVHGFLQKYDLSINPEKESFARPGEKWTFLGVSYEMGVIDVADISIEKLKGKMRRRARSLLRWQKRKNASSERTARAFIRAFNRKFFSASDHHELTWCRWYFPLINTDRGLREIDQYMQSCVRYVATGRRNKAQYDFRYEDMKRLHYHSLVNCYYKGYAGLRDLDI